jgi:hypothetical protein
MGQTRSSPTGARITAKLRRAVGFQAAPSVTAGHSLSNLQHRRSAIPIRHASAYLGRIHRRMKKGESVSEPAPDRKELLWRDRRGPLSANRCATRSAENCKARLINKKRASRNPARRSGATSSSWRWPIVGGMRHIARQRWRRFWWHPILGPFAPMAAFIGLGAAGLRQLHPSVPQKSTIECGPFFRECSTNENAPSR